MLIISIVGSVKAEGSEGHNSHDSTKVDLAPIMVHHVSDAHDWHILDIPTGLHSYYPVALHLPWFFHDSQSGFQFFSGTHALEESGKYIIAHNHIHPVLESHPMEGVNPDSVKDNPGYLVLEPEHGEGAAEVYLKDTTTSIVDLSFTKTTLQIFLVGLVMLWMFIGVAGAYRRNPNQAPKGIQSFVEPIILFVRDDIAVQNLHGKHERFMPYLLTLFFFIFFSNLFGLTPLNSNIAGNISVTVALAVLTFAITLMHSNKDYWQHIFWFPGLPVPVKLLMMPVEIIGMITKPFALCVRLFANIAAGHMMVLALIGLIFIAGQNGHNTIGGLLVSPLSLAFSTFIFSIELLVAAVQAYVFTLLTAVFIGQAMETHGHSEGDHAHH